MPEKKSRKSEVSSLRPVGEKAFREGIEKVLEIVEKARKDLDSRINQTKEHLESRVEFSRRDFGEQLKSFQKGLHGRIDKVEENLQHTQKALMGTKTDLTEKIDSMESRLSAKIDRIGTRVDDHEVRITPLEATRPHT